MLLNFLHDIPDPSNARPLGYVVSTATASLSPCKDPLLLPQGNNAAHGTASGTKINMATSSKLLYRAEQFSPLRAGIISDHKKKDTIFTGLSTGLRTSYFNTVLILSAGKFLTKYLIDYAINSFLYHRIISTDMLFISLTVLTV